MGPSYGFWYVICAGPPFGDDLLTENWRGERKQFRVCLVATGHFSPTLVSAQMQSGGTQAWQHSTWLVRD